MDHSDRIYTAEAADKRRHRLLAPNSSFGFEKRTMGLGLNLCWYGMTRRHSGRSSRSAFNSHFSTKKELAVSGRSQASCQGTQSAPFFTGSEFFRKFPSTPCCFHKAFSDVLQKSLLLCACYLTSSASPETYARLKWVRSICFVEPRSQL
jgi:hypothetical protein